MSERRLTPVLVAACAAVCTAPPALAADPAPAPSALQPSEALDRAAAGNPELAAALAEARRAAEAVVVQEERYPYVLTLDANVSRTATPAIWELGSVRVDTRDSIAGGAELGRTLPYGTKLALRLEGDRQIRETSLIGIGPGQVAIGPTYGLLARLSLVQPLLRGAGLDFGEAELRAARISRESAEGTARRVGSELARDVLTAYYELWYARAALAIEEASRDLSLRQREEAAARAAAGTLAPVEVLPFASRTASLEEAVLRAREERQRAARALGRLLGSPGPESEALAAARGPEEPGHGEVGGAIDAALRRAPELAELEVQVRLAREQAVVAGEALRSRLDLQGVLEARGLGDQEVPPAFEQVGTGEAVGALVGVVYELPFTARAQRAEAARASTAVRVAQERLRAARQRIETEVRDLVASLEVADEQVRLGTETAAIAGRQLQASEDRFEAGAGTPIAIREAEDALRQAELRVAQARLSHARAALALQHLTGQLLARAAR